MGFSNSARPRLTFSCLPPTDRLPFLGPLTGRPSSTPETWESAFTPSYAVSDRAQETLFPQLPSTAPAAAPLTTPAAEPPTALGAPPPNALPKAQGSHPW